MKQINDYRHYLDADRQIRHTGIRIVKDKEQAICGALRPSGMIYSRFIFCSRSKTGRHME